jgi:hypothetical protein
MNQANNKHKADQNFPNPYKIISFLSEYEIKLKFTYIYIHNFDKNLFLNNILVLLWTVNLCMQDL